jgi:gluconolactonase
MRISLLPSLAGAVLLFAALQPSIAQQNRSQDSPLFQAFAPEFWTLFNRNAQLEVMGSGFGFTEGPVWDSSGFLFVSDEDKNAIYRLFPDGRREEVISLGDPDGSTYDNQRRLINCASVLRAIIRLSTDGKTYAILADRYKGKRLNSPNDVIGGPDGALYFTDPTLDLVAGQKQELPFRGVYRLAGDGEVTLLTSDLDQPNGLAFSPDGRFLYVDDTARKNIRRYHFRANGTVSDGIVFADENVTGSKGVPDGMKVDTKGNLYVVGPGGIWIWTPEGKHIGTLLVPQQPANLTWGGPDNSILFITAGTSVYRIHTRAKGFFAHYKSN